MTYKNEEQAKRIEAILEDCTDKKVNPETLAVFHTLLQHVLTLPCDVVEKAELAKYELYAIENSGDEMFGLLGKVREADDKKKEVVIPVCDLRAADNRSKEYKALDDYSTWFINSQF